MVFINRHKPLKDLRPYLNAQETSILIQDLLNSSKPFMVARFGSVELEVMQEARRTLALTFSEKIYEWLKTGCYSFGRKRKSVETFRFIAGFFSSHDRLAMAQFDGEMLCAMRELDLLASWVQGEAWFERELRHVKLCEIRALDSFRQEDPWTSALEGRNVLVIHPFAKTIERQFRENRKYLFSNPRVLPDFRLETLQAINSQAGERPAGFENWHDVLDHMTEQALSSSSDVVILGCGAYGFPLAARLKRAGKQCIHLGGPTQILFGVRGSRWENPKEDSFWKSDFDSHWVRPSIEETPAKASKVESGAYW